MNNQKRKTLTDTGRSAVGKAAVVGIKDRETNHVRASVVNRTDSQTLHPYVKRNIEGKAHVHTDEATVYDSLPRAHENVKHLLSKHVRNMAHTNGIESFWALVKRGYHGLYHKMSPRHFGAICQ